MGMIGRIIGVLFLSTVICVSQPQINASLENLKNSVTIYRDHYGVPHILGQTEEATFFGYGYAQAEDHLERMMLEFRDAQGRRSEILGESALDAKRLVYHGDSYRWGGDYLQRLLRTWQAVEDNRQKIDPSVYCLLDAFAKGINLYISEHRSQIPEWIDHVSAEDVEAVQRSVYMRYYSVNDALSEISGNPAPNPRLGSNHWAIARNRSADGRTLHVEEFHSPWSNRFQMYEAHLITPGKLNAAGVSWFGSPFFLSGLTPDTTWSASYNKPNIADVYKEWINPKNTLEYLYNGKWRTIRRTEATFRVKQENGTFKTVILPLYYTHHGPIVRFDSVHHLAYAVKLPNFEGVNYSTGLYLLMKAHDLHEFRTALAKQLIPRWAFIYTDRQHIYYVHNAVMPKRDPAYNWQKPVPGWNPRTEWQGYLPFASNPQLLDPPSGFVQDSNNPGWVGTRHSGIKPLDPVHYYYSFAVTPDEGEEALNVRGERLFGVLSRPHAQFTVTQMKSLAYDTYILAAGTVIPLLDNACKWHSCKGEMKQVIEELQRWDRRSAANSYAYTYLYYWGKAYRELYGSSFDRFNKYNRDGISTKSLWEQERAWSALRAGIADLRKTFGTIHISWGQINRVIRNGSFAVDGTGLFDVLHPDTGPEQGSGQIDCDDGWGHMMVVEEGTPKRVWTLLPYGESENSSSPHYNDQTRLHSKQQLKPFWISAQEIVQNTESVWGNRTRIQHTTF